MFSATKKTQKNQTKILQKYDYQIVPSRELKAPTAFHFRTKNSFSCLVYDASFLFSDFLFSL